MLDSSVQRRRDGLTIGHPELEEHTQRIMALADQYAFGDIDHFNPWEVMKVPQILHVKRCCKLTLYSVDFIEINTGDD
jgi:regulator of sigma D